MQTDPAVTITVTLSDAQAWAFAEFLKRVGLSDFAALAVDQQEAHAMPCSALLPPSAKSWRTLGMRHAE